VSTQQYQKYRDGRGGDERQVEAQAHLAQAFAGIGLATRTGTWTRRRPAYPALKPVMTVVYVPANDMLHAFRAGPCYTPRPRRRRGSASGWTRRSPRSSMTEHGGEELWGFLPFDQMNVASLRFIHRNQTRANHVYAMAGSDPVRGHLRAGLRELELGRRGHEAVLPPTRRGVRRIMFVGRDRGQYLTALDVTATGPYTLRSAPTRRPAAAVNRATRTRVNGAPSGDEEQHGRRRPRTTTTPTARWADLVGAARRLRGRHEPRGLPDGTPADRLQFALFTGSGSGTPPGARRVDGGRLRGRPSFVLDALTGDVIASADVAPGRDAFENTIVSSPAASTRRRPAPAERAPRRSTR